MCGRCSLLLYEYQKIARLYHDATKRLKRSIGTPDDMTAAAAADIMHREREAARLALKQHLDESHPLGKDTPPLARHGGTAGGGSG
jgi:hypothetical protein